MTGIHGLSNRPTSCARGLAFGLLIVACGDDTSQTTFDPPGTDTGSSSTDPTSASADESTMGSADETSSGGPADESTTSAETTTSDGTTTIADDSTSTGGAEESSSSGAVTAEESSSDDGVDTNPNCDPAIPCAAGEIPNDPLPSSAMGSTACQDSEFASSCGGGGAPDMAFTFTAPFDGDFLFDTFGSSYDTVLYILDGTCAGSVIDCSDDDIGTASLAGATLVAGQTVTVVVDGFGLQGDDFVVTAREGSLACPIEDLGSAVPQSVMGQNAVASNDFNPTCGAGGSPDTEYVFTAPETGTYIVDTNGSAFDTVLFALDGNCAGPELGCNNDAPGQFGPSLLVLELDAGQVVTFGVEGFFGGLGDFMLNIELFDGTTTCPTEDLGNTVPQTVEGQTVVATDSFMASCGNGATNDTEYLFTAPYDGVFTFDTVGSQFDTVLFALNGDCAGAELVCNDQISPNQFGPSGFSLQMTQGQTVTLIVEGSFGAAGNFTLNIGELEGSCPDGDLGNMIPTVQMGSTAATDNAGGGSCGGLFGNDVSYTWTAPADGLYMFDTEGSNFDTIVYVRDGDCTGAELGCSAQFGGQSLVVEQLVAGQTVVVTIDGDGVSGDYTLTIDEAPPGGDCCIPHNTPGCAVPEIEDCVCAIDGFCCSNQWDNLCAGEAVNPCGAACP